MEQDGDFVCYSRVRTTRSTKYIVSQPHHAAVESRTKDEIRIDDITFCRSGRIDVWSPYSFMRLEYHDSMGMGWIPSYRTASHPSWCRHHHRNGSRSNGERTNINTSILASLWCRLCWGNIPLLLRWMVGISRRSRSRGISHGNYSTLSPSRILDECTWSAIR